MFRVGQKVVCVRDKDFTKFIRIGYVYTINSIAFEYGFTWLRFNEVRNLVPGDSGGFDADRFRPIVERKTDISVFKAMLTPAGKERVDAQT